jgi:hypothetical protein
MSATTSFTPAKTAVRGFAAGRLISVTGGAAAYTALNFTVWHLTHSPGMQALSLLLTFGVAGILGPFAGALGDRFDRRRVMVISEAVAAVFFAAMFFATDPGVLIALAFGSALAELPFFSASRAAIPNLASATRTSRGPTASSRSGHAGSPSTRDGGCCRPGRRSGVRHQRGLVRFAAHHADRTPVPVERPGRRARRPRPPHAYGAITCCAGCRPPGWCSSSARMSG